MIEIMGILNVTPDSFSDGGQWTGFDAAIAHAESMRAAGATIIDVGGESTRPGAERVPVDEEHSRVIPVVAELAGRGLRVSVDTLNASTARAALDAGAVIVNDVSGGLADPAMSRVVAGSNAIMVAMHWRGHSDAMNLRTDYTDVAAEVREHLARRIDALVGAGIDRDRLIIDPGLGFAKTSEQNWRVLSSLNRLAGLAPVLVGASRKRFLGALLPAGAPVEDRDLPTAVVSALSARAGAWGVRVHDVAATKAALDVVAAWDGAAPTESHG